MKDEHALIKVIDNDNFKIGLRSDSIIHIYVKSEREVNRRIQEEIVQSIIHLKDGDTYKYPQILEIGEFVSISKGAISHESLPFKEHVLCIAFYVKNIADRIIAKYYTKKYETSSEFVFFSDFDKAVKFCYSKMDEAGMKYTPIL